MFFNTSTFSCEQSIALCEGCHFQYFKSHGLYQVIILIHYLENAVFNKSFLKQMNNLNNEVIETERHIFIIIFLS